MRGEKRWVLRTDGRVGGWLRAEGGGVAARSFRIAMIIPPPHHPPPSLSRTEAYLHRSLRFRCVSSRLPCPPPPGPRLEQQTRFFGEPPPVVGGLTREIYFGVFATCFATNVFHRNIFGERRFPRRRQERPPRRPPTIEIPCYFCVPQTPHCFPIAAIDRRHSLLEESKL